MNNLANEPFLRHIADASREDKLVILVGAGVSMNSGLLSWEQLALKSKHIISKLESNLTDDIIKGDLISYFEKFTQYSKRKELDDFIISEFDTINPQANYVHNLLFQLKPHTIITTNYDMLLEQYDNSHTNTYSQVQTNKSVIDTYKSKCIIKMHGDIEKGDMVVTKSDYSKYSQGRKTILSQIHSRIVERGSILLLVGFSGSDPNINLILGEIKNQLGDYSLPMYLLSSDAGDTYDNVELVNNSIIKVINPLNHDYTFESGINESSIQQQTITQHILQVDTLEAVRGKAVANSLFYVKQLSRIIDEETKIEQLYNELKHYEYVGCLYENDFRIILDYLYIKSSVLYARWTISESLLNQILEIKSTDPSKYRNFIRLLDKFFIYQVEDSDSNNTINIKNELNTFQQSNSEFNIQFNKMFDLIRVFNYTELKNEVDLKSSDDILFTLCKSYFLQSIGLHNDALNELLSFYDNKNVENSSLELWYRVLLQLHLKSAFQAVYRNIVGYNGLSVERVWEIKERVESFNILNFIENNYSGIPLHFKYFIIKLFNRDAIYWHEIQIQLACERINEAYQQVCKGAWSMYQPSTIQLLDYQYQNYNNFLGGNLIPHFFWWEDKSIANQYIQSIIKRYATDAMGLRIHDTKEPFYEIELSELTYEHVISLVYISDYNLLVETFKYYSIQELKVSTDKLDDIVTAFNNLISFTCEFNSNWSLLNTHQKQILNFIVVIGYAGYQFPSSLWSKILQIISNFVYKCTINEKFVEPFRLLINSIPDVILPSISTEISTLIEEFAKAMLLTRSQKLFHSKEAGQLLLSTCNRLNQNNIEGFTYSQEYCGFIEERISNWGGEENDIETPYFINYILISSYPYLHTSTQSLVSNFIRNRFSIESMRAMLMVFVRASINRIVDFDDEHKSNFAATIVSYLGMEPSDIPFGYKRSTLFEWVARMLIHKVISIDTFSIQSNWCKVREESNFIQFCSAPTTIDVEKFDVAWLLHLDESERIKLYTHSTLRSEIISQLKVALISESLLHEIRENYILYLEEVLTTNL